MCCLKPFLAFIDHWIHLNESGSTEGTKWTNSLKVKVSDSSDNVPYENVVTTGEQQTDQQSDWPTAWIARVAICH